MKQLLSISFILVLSSLYCFNYDSQINLEGRVTEAQSGDPIPFARVELYKSGWYSGDLLANTQADSFGNFTMREEIENCSLLSITAVKNGFHSQN